MVHDMDSRKLKILHVARDAKETGGGRVAQELAWEMHQQGHEVLILSDINFEAKGGTKVISTIGGDFLKGIRVKNKLIKTFRHFAQMLMFTIFGTIKAVSYRKKGWIIINHNCEIIVGDLFVFHNVFNFENKKKKFVRRFIRWLNPAFFFRAIREYFVFYFCHESIFVAVSKTTASEVKYFTKNKDIFYINNGVNLSDYKPLMEIERYRLREENGVNDKFVLLFVGHEFERKGLIFIIDSLKYLPANVILHVVGGQGSYLPFYEEYVKQKSLIDRVIFLGTQNNTLPFFQMSDLFVLPSSYEAFVLAGLESLSAGTPVLVTDVGGFKECLQEGCNGYFILRTVNDISDKIKIVMSKSDEEIGYMRLSARRSVSLFSWEIITERYLSLLINNAIKEKV